MSTKLYDPARIVRDPESGMFFHPDLPVRADELDCTPEIHAQGFELHTVFGDFDWHPETGYWAAMRAWEPEAPAGEGWLLAGIADSEDGPVAWFVRPLERGASPDARAH